MSEYKQQISAFLDGELGDAEIRRLQPDLEAAEFSTASRYQMISSALRDEAAEMIDISDQVRVAILQEANPVLAAPQINRTQQTSGWFGISWFRPAAGMAMAALVAVVMVVSLSDQQPPNATAVVAEQAPMSLSPQILAAQPVSNEIRPAANLDSYLKAHSEFAAQDTMQSRMPYARAVTYESRN